MWHRQKRLYFTALLKSKPLGNSNPVDWPTQTTWVSIKKKKRKKSWEKVVRSKQQGNFAIACIMIK